MELCAIAVVIVLFIAVLKQFGILEPMSMEGNSSAEIQYVTGAFTHAILMQFCDAVFEAKIRSRP